MDENIKRAWQGKVAHLEARLQEAEAKYEERVNQHEEYIAFSDEEINGLIEKKRLVMARLAEEVASHDNTRAIQTAAQVKVLMLQERLARVERLAAMLRDPRQWVQNEWTTRISREIDESLRPLTR